MNVFKKKNEVNALRQIVLLFSFNYTTFLYLLSYFYITFQLSWVCMCIYACNKLSPCPWETHPKAHSYQNFEDIILSQNEQ